MAKKIVVGKNEYDNKIFDIITMYKLINISA